MRISDWSSDVCSSDLQAGALCGAAAGTDTSRNTFIGYRMTGEGSAPRRDDLRHTDYRFQGGVRGEIAPGIRYDVGALRAVAIFNENYQNDIDPVKAKKALQVDRKSTRLNYSH